MTVSSTLDSIDFHNASRVLNDKEREDFISRIWSTGREYNSLGVSAYFEFLQSERRIAEKRRITFTFKDFFALTNFLCDHHDKSRDGILTELQTSQLIPVPDDSLRVIVKLVIRSFLLVRLEFCDSSASLYPGELPMPPDESLRGILQNFGNVQHIRGGSAGERYPEWFNAIDLERKAGMKIRWTDYITDHLTIQGGTLLLFRHTEALKYIEKSAILYVDYEILENFAMIKLIRPRIDKFLDKDFFAETRRSVLLFFPQDHEGVRLSALDYSHWVAGGEAPEFWQSQLLRDSQEGRVSRLSIDYPVWHQKLGYVLEVSQSQSNLTLSRIWNDDRDQALWWTRWALIVAAFFTILFGLIQSITGIIQVVHAT